MNNPRQIRSKNCGCKLCTAQYRPEEKATRKDCTGSWQARYRDPSGTQRSENFPTKAKAEAFLDRMRDAVRSGTWVDPDRGKLSLAAWHAMWWPSQDPGETTVERIDSAWRNQVKPHFGDWRLMSISHLAVQVWITRLGKGVGVASIVKAYNLLRQMLDAAVRDGRIPKNPCDGIKLPEAPGKHPDDLMPPTYDQLAAARELIADHYHAMLIVAEETGLRWGELVGLRLCWVNFRAKTIQVREVMIEVRSHPKRKAYPKTIAGFRTIPLTDRAAHAIKEHLKKNPAVGTKSEVTSGLHPEELVFRGPLAGRKRAEVDIDGVMRRRNFHRVWTKACEKAGFARKVLNPKTNRYELWPHFHEVRHAFASRLHALGVSEADAQKILGHERGGKITWLYTHASAGAVDSVRSALERPALRAV